MGSGAGPRRSSIDDFLESIDESRGEIDSMSEADLSSLLEEGESMRAKASHEAAVKAPRAATQYPGEVPLRLPSGPVKRTYFPTDQAGVKPLRLPKMGNGGGAAAVSRSASSPMSTTQTSPAGASPSSSRARHSPTTSTFARYSTSHNSSRALAAEASASANSRTFSARQVRAGLDSGKKLQEVLGGYTAPVSATRGQPPSDIDHLMEDLGLGDLNLTEEEAEAFLLDGVVPQGMELGGSRLKSSAHKAREQEAARDVASQARALSQSRRESAAIAAQRKREASQQGDLLLDADLPPTHGKEPSGPPPDVSDKTKALLERVREKRASRMQSVQSVDGAAGAIGGDSASKAKEMLDALKAQGQREEAEQREKKESEEGAAAAVSTPAEAAEKGNGSAAVVSTTAPTAATLMPAIDQEALDTAATKSKDGDEDAAAAAASSSLADSASDAGDVTTLIKPEEGGDEGEGEGHDTDDAHTRAHTSLASAQSLGENKGVDMDDAHARADTSIAPSQSSESLSTPLAVVKDDPLASSSSTKEEARQPPSSTSTSRSVSASTSASALDTPRAKSPVATEEAQLTSSATTETSDSSAAPEEEDLETLLASLQGGDVDVANIAAATAPTEAPPPPDVPRIATPPPSTRLGSPPPSSTLSPSASPMDRGLSASTSGGSISSGSGASATSGGNAAPTAVPTTTKRSTSGSGASRPPVSQSHRRAMDIPRKISDHNLADSAGANAGRSSSRSGSGSRNAGLAHSPSITGAPSTSFEAGSPPYGSDPKSPRLKARLSSMRAFGSLGRKSRERERGAGNPVASPPLPVSGGGGGGGAASRSISSATRAERTLSQILRDADAAMAEAGFDDDDSEGGGGDNAAADTITARKERHRVSVLPDDGMDTVDWQGSRDDGDSDEGDGRYGHTHAHVPAHVDEELKI